MGKAKPNSPQGKLEKLKSHRLVAVAIIVGTAIIALGDFTDALRKLWIPLIAIRNHMSLKSKASTTSNATTTKAVAPNQPATPNTTPLPRPQVTKPIDPAKVQPAPNPQPECKFIFLDISPDTLSINSLIENSNLPDKKRQREIRVDFFNANVNSYIDVIRRGPEPIVSVKEFKDILYDHDQGIYAIIEVVLVNPDDDSKTPIGGWKGPISFKKEMYYRVDDYEHPPIQDNDFAKWNAPTVTSISYEDAVRRASKLEMKALPKCDDIELGIHRVGTPDRSPN